MKKNKGQKNSLKSFTEIYKKLDAASKAILDGGGTILYMDKNKDDIVSIYFFQKKPPC